MKTQQLFRSGQNVTWGDLSEAMRFVTGDCGPGPFKVLSVQNIPENSCGCGGSLNDEIHQRYFGCPYSHMGYGSVRKSVGHPQWLTLDDGDGKPMSSVLLCGEKRIRTFSGAYFKAA